MCGAGQLGQLDAMRLMERATSTRLAQPAPVAPSNTTVVVPIEITHLLDHVGVGGDGRLEQAVEVLHVSGLGRALAASSLVLAVVAVSLYSRPSWLTRSRISPPRDRV